MNKQNGGPVNTKPVHDNNDGEETLTPAQTAEATDALRQIHSDLEAATAKATAAYNDICGRVDVISEWFAQEEWLESKLLTSLSLRDRKGMEVILDVGFQKHDWRFRLLHPIRYRRASRLIREFKDARRLVVRR